MSRAAPALPLGISPAAERCPSVALPVVLLIALFLAGSAAAHQSLLFAHVRTRPAAPPAGEPFELLVHLTDSSHRDVTGVELVARVAHVAVAGADEGAGGAQEPAGATRLSAEPGSGRYRALVPARPAGEYRLTLEEIVDGQSETSASTQIVVGGEAPVEMQLVLPPSGRSGLGTWLVWLVGLPLLAGLLVTLLVLTGRPKPEDE
jgi:hypothetical protein